MKRLLSVTLMLGLIAAAVVAVVRQRSADGRLRREIASLDQNKREENRLRADNLRLSEILGQRKRDLPAPVPPAELERLRQEIAMWERRAGDLERTKAAGDIATNRDPEKGMVKLEYFRNVGRATPMAAMQTAIWAAAQGDFDELAKTMAMSAADRVKGQAYLDQQTAEMRAKFNSPEKLLSVVFAHGFSDAEGFQLVSSTAAPEGRVVVSLRRRKNGTMQPNDEKIPIQPGPDGWQIAVPNGAIEGLRGFLTHQSLEIAPPAKK